jgi:hypothetical protein
MLEFAFYSETDGQHSTLVLNNNSGLQSLPVDITLFSSHGEPFALPTVIVPPDSPTRLELRDLMANAPREMRLGNIECVYTGGAMDLTGQVSIVSERTHTVFESRMAMEMDNLTNQAKGILWLPRPQAEVSLALTNTKPQPLNVSVKVGGNDPILLTLNYRETRILKRQDFEAKGARLPNGAILAISQSGVPGDLIVTGAVIDDESEYASNILLVDPSSMISRRWQASILGAELLFSPPLFWRTSVPPQRRLRSL